MSFNAKENITVMLHILELTKELNPVKILILFLIILISINKLSIYLVYMVKSFIY